MQVKFLLPAISMLVLAACNKPEGCMDPLALNYDPEAEVDKGCTYAEGYPLEMHFHGALNGGELVEEQQYTINGVATQINLLQFYVSGISLISADGDTVTSDTYLLVRPETEEYAIGDFPAGDYTKLIFHVGIDSLTNHADPSQYNLGDPLSAQTPSMHWGWSFGYIFLRIDGEVDSDADGSPDPAGTFEMHMGDDHYLKNIELDYAVTIGDGLENIVHLDADWDSFFTGVDMVNDNTVHGTDNLSLAALLFDNLSNVFSAEE